VNDLALNIRTLSCQRCEGIGWLRRLVPGLAGGLVTVTRVCPTCQGHGKIGLSLSMDAKSAAAGEVAGLGPDGQGEFFE